MSTATPATDSPITRWPAARVRLPDSAAPTASAGGKWLHFLALNLLGYALLGKGWAYIGIPPLFIGEALLFCGLVWLIVSGNWARFLQHPSFLPLLLLGVWGIARTWPDVSAYGVDALRDAAIWGYGAFALIAFAYVLARPARLATLLRLYNRFTVIFLVGAPLAWFGYRFLGDAIPNWPWVNMPVVVPKGGDIQVHLAGILAFWVSGLGGAISLWRVLLLVLSLVAVGSYDRAGLLSFLLVGAVCFCAKPRDRSLWRLAGIVVAGLVFLAASDFRIKMPNREREISFEQVVANFASYTGTAKVGDLDATKEWRLEWWKDIVNYTVNGKYFWTGKGFGINLAEDDGYQLDEDNALRSPHNGHLTMLARGGVPGTMLWALVQFSWGWAMVRGYLHSRRAGDERWAGIFLFLLAYGMAFMANTTFDVFIEGPMGGIWYWTIYGVGLAALWLYRHDPTACRYQPPGIATPSAGGAP